MPPSPKKLPEIFLRTSHLDSYTVTDVKPDMISGVQTGNGISHDIYNIRGISHAPTNRKDYSEGKGPVKNKDRTQPELTQP